jgi:tetratricopeptide (TPR) repeat protein
MKQKNLTDLSSDELHNKGARLREEDKHIDALQYLTLAIVFYQKEGRYKELVDALKDRCLTWKHLFLLSKDKACLILALKDAEAMLSITEEYKLKDRYGTSYFRLGEITMLFKDYQKAAIYYQKAIYNYVGSLSEKGDYRYHLGEAIFRSGEKKKGKITVLEGIGEIKKGSSRVDPFLVHVWESGAYIKLAELIVKDDKKEAIRYLGMAEK